ncbi:hypothetical protein ACFQX7_27595 [Luedemannella flava]
MAGQGGATLRILERADKEIMKLSRSDRGAVWEFVSKFRTNPGNPGLHFKQLKVTRGCSPRGLAPIIERCCCTPAITTTCSSQ